MKYFSTRPLSILAASSFLGLSLILSSCGFLVSEETSGTALMSSVQTTQATTANAKTDSLESSVATTGTKKAAAIRMNADDGSSDASYRNNSTTASETKQVTTSGLDEKTGQTTSVQQSGPKPSLKTTQPTTVQSAVSDKNGSGIQAKAIAHGSVVETKEEHLFWREDKDPMRKQIAEILYKGLLEHKTEIDIASAFNGKAFAEDPTKMIGVVVYSVKDTDPRFFFYEQEYRYRYNYTTTTAGTVYNSYVLEFKYLSGMQTRNIQDAEWSKLNNAAWAVVDSIASKTTDLKQRYLLALDWVVKNSYYSPTSNRVTNNAYYALLKRETMCVGYSLAFQMIANRLGGNAITVYGFAQEAYEKKGEYHNWNMVKLGDKWYHLDCTWSDVSKNGDAKVHDETALPVGTYLFRSQKDISDHEVYSYVIPKAEEDLPTGYDKVANDEELKNKISELFKKMNSAGNSEEVLYLDYGLSNEAYEGEKLNQLIEEAYYAANVYYGVTWVGRCNLGRFFLRVYPQN